MGLFTWFKSDNGTNICWGDEAILLLPDNRKSIKGTYDGYGRIGGHDVYYYFALMNREIIIANKEILGVDENSIFLDLSKDEQYFIDHEYDLEEEIRIYGIKLQYHKPKINYLYPIKIVEKDALYADVEASKEDPDQGFCRSHIDKGRLLTCEYCGNEYWQNEGYDDEFCSCTCWENYHEEENEEEDFF